MIAWLRGSILAVALDHVVIDVAGVGYLVQVSARDAATWSVGDDAEVLVHTVVREDALLLYGFRTPASHDLFTSLVSVTGVGPKGALALLSELTPREIALAIHNEQTRELTRAKGIGKRTAELLVVRLRERLPVELLAGEPVAATQTQAPAAAATPAVRDAVSALVNLGFRPIHAREAVDEAVASGASDELAVLVRSALALLHRRTAT